MSRRPSGRTQDLAAAALIAGVNVFVCWRLFFLHYAANMFSIEAAYIALTRYVSANWGDLLWFPSWYDGLPFQNAYQPGLPIFAAAFTTVFRMEPAHAYHFACALLYCAGPIGIYFLASRLSGRRAIGLIAALVVSLFSPSVLLASVVRYDAGSILAARRLQALLHYGEGPNVGGLNIVPFALWALHSAITKFSPLRFLAAAVAMAITVIVSWPATVVMAMAVAAYLISREWKELRSRLAVLAAIAICGYLLIAPLDPPSTILDNQRNSQRIGGNYHYTPAHILYFSALALAIIGSHFLLRRFRISRFLEFSWIWTLTAASVALPAYWFGVALLPQPERFHLGMELGIALVVGYGATKLFDALGRYPKLRAALVEVVIAAALFQAYKYHRFARGLTQPLDITSTVEYRVSRWFDTNMHGGRVFATGSVAFWMNAWTDQPQVTGCCLPGLPNPMGWIAGYFIPSADGAGDHAAEYSLLWLKAYGAQAAAVGGPATRNVFRDWAHPSMFDGLLTKTWEEGDDRIYAIPVRSQSLARVMRESDLAPRAPINGIDVDPLRHYVAALDNSSYPLATWTWLNDHQARVQAQLGASEILSVQETFVPGWHASLSGRPLRIWRDPLGLIAIDPAATGALTIDLVYDGGTEHKLLLFACATTWLALVLWAGASLAIRIYTSAYFPRA